MSGPQLIILEKTEISWLLIPRSRVKRQGRFLLSIRFSGQMSHNVCPFRNLFSFDTILLQFTQATIKMQQVNFKQAVTLFTKLKLINFSFSLLPNDHFYEILQFYHYQQILEELHFPNLYFLHYRLQGVKFLNTSHNVLF